MEMKSFFSGSISLLARVLDLRHRNHEVIVNNVANADTPGYKAFHMQVDEALQRLAERPGAVQMARTHSGHLDPFRQGGAGREKISREPSDAITFRGDGNTVDMDRAMGRLAENSLMYNAAAQLIQRKFQALKAVIQGGSGGR
jgi:flagellar basal-body rod protein FlgB